MTTRLRRPCNNCPWRVDAPRGHWDPTHFQDIWRNCQDDGISGMLCHKATALPVEQRNALPCQGWARVMGFDAVGVRIAVMRGTLTLEEVEDHGGPTLFASFRLMLRANNVKLPARNRFVPVQLRRKPR